jgi:glycosyltransferase involved in cell wall biosynthesis
VIYDGVITDESIPNIQSRHNDYFLFVGRLCDTKGIMEVLSAYMDYCSKVSTPLKLKIAGTGPCVEKIRLMMHESSNVELLGYCNNIPELMKGARALIVASKCEAFGFITTEALFNGCLVIGKNTGGTKMQFDKVNNNKTCIRYDLVEDLTRILCDVSIVDMDYLLSERKESQERVLKLFSASASASKVVNFYKSIIR